MYAHMIKNFNIKRRFDTHWIICLAPDPCHYPLSPESNTGLPGFYSMFSLCACRHIYFQCINAWLLLSIGVTSVNCYFHFLNIAWRSVQYTSYRHISFLSRSEPYLIYKYNHVLVFYLQTVLLCLCCSKEHHAGVDVLWDCVLRSGGLVPTVICKINSIIFVTSCSLETPCFKHPDVLVKSWIV